MRARATAIAASPWLPWALLAVLIAWSGWFLLDEGRGNSFFYDDWSYLLERRDWTIDTFLEPHNEHLQAVSVLVYKLIFETVGLRDYWVFQAVLVLGNLTTGVLLFVYARPRVGPWVALPLVASVVLMTSSWYVLFWAFMMCFTLATAAGVGAFVAFDRRTRRADVVGTVLLVFALASSSLGVTFLIGAAIEWILRDDRWRRWWVVVVPGALYGLWRIVYEPPRTGRLSNWTEIPSFVTDGYDDAVSNLLGLGGQYGVVLACVLVVLVVREFLDPERTTPRLVALVAMPIVFWGLTALGRAGQGIQADENRYLYPAGVLVVLAVVELGRRYPQTRRLTVAVTAILAFGAVMTANGVPSGADQYRNISATGRPAATSYDIAGEINPTFQEGDPTFPFVPAEKYLDAVTDYGPMGWTEEELETSVDEQDALRVDQAVQRLVRAQVVELPADHPVGPEPPRVVVASRGTATPQGDCLAAAGPPDAFLEVEVPAPGLIIRAGDAGVDVRLRRFGPLVPEGALGNVAEKATGGIELPADKSRKAWVARLQSQAAFEVCSSVTG